MVRPNSNPGSLASVKIEPDTSYVSIINRCRTTISKSKHAYSLYRKPFTNMISVKGNFWTKAYPGKEYIAINNPPLYMATVFKEILEGKNIRVMGKARVIDETDMYAIQEDNILATTTSSLRQSIAVANKRSQGFYAEQILKTLGAIINDEGSFSGGLDVIKDFLTRLGIPEDQYQIDDGSGLSKKNKLTPDTITTLLNYMYNHKDADIFVKSLPISGTDGTLKKRLKEEPYKSRVMAKTGYVYGARTLSGYVKTLDEEVIAFSILVNEIKGGTWKAKRLQDIICRFLVTYN
jgi:D-alanyl-D-alanine carboxypeptidase/D-alanyl-D-alanine-endopeptidase (penicillin-binding protein 4)